MGPSVWLQWPVTYGLISAKITADNRLISTQLWGGSCILIDWGWKHKIIINLGVFYQSFYFAAFGQSSLQINKIVSTTEYFV